MSKNRTDYNTEYVRNKRASMTPEERERHLEERRKRRRDKIKNESPKEREERLRKNREAMRNWRAGK